MRPAGSAAADAFAAARRQLAAYAPAPERRPAVDLVPLSAGAAPPAPAGARPGVADGDTIAGAALAAGRPSSSELVERALEAAVLRDGPLRGVVALDPRGARAAAAARDAELVAGRIRGPLHGIPVTVKDVIDVAGLPTRAGSEAYARAPARDAEGVARLRRAGAVVLGKVSTHEFALGVCTPQSRNPHDHARIPGGSSGGSAIAVATGIGLGSLGTDTRASIRVPSALCGVVGLKLTYGRVPTDGVVTLSWTMDHVAPIARRARDAALMAEALAPELSGLAGWAGADVTGWRLGVPEAAFAGCEAGVARAARAAVAALVDAGVVAVPVPRPSAADLERANAAGLVISRAEALTYHLGLGLDRSAYWEEVADQLAEAERLTAVDYLTAQRMRAELAEALGRAFAGGVRALAMPTTPVAAPRVEDFAAYLTVLSRNAIPWSLVGFPAITVPCGTVAGGLPVGLQLVAPPGAEHHLVALAAAVEALTTSTPRFPADPPRREPPPPAARS